MVFPEQILETVEVTAKSQARWLTDDSAMRSASLLAGLHPDSAALALVMLALKLNTPFAVVPCCVFPNSIEQLKAVNVRTHHDFVNYIESLDTRIRREFLPFAGRNTVLFMRPDDPPIPRAPSQDPTQPGAFGRKWTD